MQTCTGHSERSGVANLGYPALLETLLTWADGGPKPAPQAIAARCQVLQASDGPGCRFLPDHQPQPLESRVPPRQRA